MKRLMFSRGMSICGAALCALLLLAGLSTSASAGQIYATSYDLYNGSGSAGYGNITLYDDFYNAPGAPRTTAYAYMSGGLGDLTDGIAATLNWWDGVWPPGQSLDQNIPYVAWDKNQLESATGLSSPFVTFHFASTENIDEVKINMNYGYHANPVDFLMGGVTVTGTVDNVDPGTANKWYDFTGLGLSGDTLTLTFHYNPEWVFVSEVQFYGTQTNAVPEPTTMLLLGSGLLGLWGARRKFKK